MSKYHLALRHIRRDTSVFGDEVHISINELKKTLVLVRVLSELFELYARKSATIQHLHFLKDPLFEVCKSPIRLERGNVTGHNSQTTKPPNSEFFCDLIRVVL